MARNAAPVLLEPQCEVICSVLLVGGVHPLVTGIGYLLGMRPTAR